MNTIKPDDVAKLAKEKTFENIVEFEEITENSLKNIAELQKIFPNWTRENAIKKLRKTIAKKDLRFIGKTNGELIAHLKITLKKSNHSHIAEMNSLIVKELHRRKGLATKLITFSISKLPKNIKIITLTVDSKNKTAISLYKKIGFEKYGLLKNGTKTNGKFVDNVLMVKELKNNKKR
ncbi:MAG: GNAT family N-acetyltransferase [Candidatus ainarchaeum sp.]|nr:GNAT family N-acetyltransferase [Candidatus ainarchaeum sp.]